MKPWPQRTHLATHAGFSLVEVIAVIAVLGILAAVVVSVAIRPATGLVGEADQLAAHLRYVQSRALADVQPWRLEFVGSTAYRLGRVGDAWIRIPATDSTQRSLTAGVTVSGASEVRFDPWGRPTDSGGSPLGSDLVLTLTEGAQSRTVVVTAATGLIR